MISEILRDDFQRASPEFKPKRSVQTSTSLMTVFQTRPGSQQVPLMVTKESIIKHSDLLRGS